MRAQASRGRGLLRAGSTCFDDTELDLPGKVTVVRRELQEGCLPKHASSHQIRSAGTACWLSESGRAHTAQNDQNNTCDILCCVLKTLITEHYPNGSLSVFHKCTKEGTCSA